jgi:hypothetical protein
VDRDRSEPRRSIAAQHALAERALVQSSICQWLLACETARGARRLSGVLPTAYVRGPEEQEDAESGDRGEQ